MLVHRICTPVAAVLAVCARTAAAGSFVSSPVQVLETRQQASSSKGYVLKDVPDVINSVVRGRDTPSVYSSNASLDLSWNKADLFSYGMVSVSCVTCYVKGNARVTLTIDQEFNLTSTLEDLAQAFVSEIENITTIAFDTFQNWTEIVSEGLYDTAEDCITFDGCNDFDWDAYAFPALPVDFDIDMAAIPEAKIQMLFDAFELYLELDVSFDISSTYTIPLYPTSGPMQPAGFDIGGQQLGIVISLDLILGLDAQVNMTTGVHVQFEDGLSLELALFGSDVSTINLSPGTFEFLPVTVSTSGITMDATLRLAITSGIEMNSEALGDYKVGAGTSATAYADIAHFSTNITPSDTSIVLKARYDSSYASDCMLPVIESYELGLGAQAGAYVVFLNDTWGPTPETFVQVFYTTLYSACAIMPSATASGASSMGMQSASEAKRTDVARLADRDDASSTMATATSEYTLTNIVCKTTDLTDCPASLQSTTQTTKTSTFSSLVATGAQVTFPATTDTSVTIKAFGTGVKSVSASSGVPVSYIPPPTPSINSSASSAGSTASGIGGAIGGAIDDANDSYKGLSESNKRLAIGLSVGLGGALLVGLGALAAFCVRRRRADSGPGDSGSVSGGNSGVDASQPFLVPTYSSQQQKWDTGSNLIAPRVHERELLHQPTAYASPRSDHAS